MKPDLKFQMGAMITLERARELAESSIRISLAPLVAETPKHWLRDGQMEGTNCWLFLKARDLKFKDEKCAAWADTAIVVSKKGTVVSIADHYEDEAALREYLAKMSAYLESRGE